MSDFPKLPRDLIALIASNPRSIRFIENLQSQAFDLMPSAIQSLILAIQGVQGVADDALALAQAANAREIPDVELNVLPVCADQDVELPMVVVLPEFDVVVGVVGLLEEYTTDPVAPQQGEQWILKTTTNTDVLSALVGGFPVVTPTPISTFDLSINTSDGIKRVAIT